MRVTDAQVHVWEDNRPDSTRNPGIAPSRSTPFTVDQLLEAMGEAEVDRVVLVPPRGTAGVYPRIDTLNEYAFSAVRLHPHRFAVMARLDPQSTDGPANLAKMMRQPGMKGLRLNLKWEPLEAMEWIWSEAVRQQMPVTILAKDGTLPQLLPVIERNPELRLIIDHAALPAVGPDPFADLDQVLALEKYSNVVVKVSGFTRHSREDYPFRDIHRHIRRLFNAFGAQRLAWGSDYSLERGRVPYRQTVDLIREECDFLSASDREWILDKTLARALRWED